ncbi:HNH endonuclease [Paenibacillus sp. VCA1]|uniref:HNH endonuclease n=1 Tax=Paenibacillus sp. VCA1 TaxID=3039148 RepID=UPI002871356F|nr:HNH endonuclease [Paenibacillus sp. VCA1]MDR9852943.1 HNH endonuclease [Paenibacillus sp. VCA1]
MRTITLSRGKQTVVDDEDYDQLSQFKWWVDAYGYALTTVGGRLNKKNIRMHRMLTGAQPGQVVDHIDGDPLNNQKANLRIVTQKENVRNSKPKPSRSGYKGVSWYSQTNRWVARIICDGVYYHIGYYHDPKDAARAYNAKALELFGEYARLNVIPDDEEAA